MQLEKIGSKYDKAQSNFLNAKNERRRKYWLKQTNKYADHYMQQSIKVI